MLRKFYKRLTDKLSRKYRLEFIDDITLSRSREYVLKPITVIVMGMLLLVGIVGGTAALVLYTPAIHRHIPNYIDPAEFDAKMEQTNQILLRMEQQVANRDTLLKSIQQISGLDAEQLVNPGSALQQMKPDPIQEPVSSVVSAVETPAESPAETVIPVSQSEYRAEESAVAYPASEKKVIRASYFSPLMNLFPPVEGKIRNGFKPEDSHYGVDIVADEKALVRSVMDGFVVVSEYSDENGHMIGVAGEGNLIAFYKHNSINYKKVGSYVFAGEPIAVIGNSGENSTGPHLHFELWEDGQPIDPSEFIKFNQ
jgi:murein DD-endopeptidase MepM/ murein hydrolase activator NlpD